MAHQFVEQVAQLEGGKALLINFADGLQDGSVSASLFKPFAAACLKGFDACNAAAEDYDARRRHVLNRTVYSPPSDESGQPIHFQYACTLPDPPPCAIETVLTWHKLMELIPEGSELMTKVKDELWETSFQGADLRYPSDEEMGRVAARVNELGPRSRGFRLSYCAGGFPLPIWITLASEVDLILANTGPDDAATRIRDWLGLGHVLAGAPLFAFRSKRVLPDPKAQPLGRPTVWDGIAHAWFKHRHAHDYKDGWGRTMDLAEARCGDPGCDGGPEAVTPAPLFGDDFECRYLGRVETPPPSVRPNVVDALLRRHGGEMRTFSDAEREIDAVLTEPPR